MNTTKRQRRKPGPYACTGSPWVSASWRTGRCTFCRSSPSSSRSSTSTSPCMASGSRFGITSPPAVSLAASGWTGIGFELFFTPLSKKDLPGRKWFRQISLSIPMFQKQASKRTPQGCPLFAAPNSAEPLRRLMARLKGRKKTRRGIPFSWKR